MSAPHTNPIETQPLLPRRMDNARSLLWVLCIMALLAGLSLLFARGTTRLAGDWTHQLKHTATVQIIHSSAETREAQQQTALDALTGLMPQARITLLTEAQARELLKPWLGDTPLPDDLPLPSLITLGGDAPIPREAIEGALSAQGLIANIDDHEYFADGIRATARRLFFLGAGLLVILLGASLAISLFATRASLSAQRDIIRVMVQVGASNGFIARLFITQASKRAAIGALFGLSLAIIFWIIFSLFGLGGDVGWRKFTPALIDSLWIIGLGLFFVLVCALAAGLTTAKYLSEERRISDA